jgi:hypothetical protein
MEHNRTRSVRERMANYQAHADRLRRMAAEEAIESIRNELLSVARQYQELVNNLKRDMSDSSF